MTLRQHFDEQLQSVISEILRLGEIATDMLTKAVDSVITGNSELAREVIDRDDEIDEAEVELIKRVVIIVMREAPVARDLKMLVICLGTVGEIEKIGDEATKLARRALKLKGRFPAEMKRSLQELSELTRQNVGAAFRLFVEYDPELAASMVEVEKEIDSRYEEARSRTNKLLQENPSQADEFYTMVEVFHALEHAADHAVEIRHRIKMHSV